MADMSLVQVGTSFLLVGGSLPNGKYSDKIYKFEHTSTRGWKELGVRLESPKAKMAVMWLDGQYGK